MPHSASAPRLARHWKARPAVEHLEPRQLLSADPLLPEPSWTSEPTEPADPGWTSDTSLEVVDTPPPAEELQAWEEPTDSWTEEQAQIPSEIPSSMETAPPDAMDGGLTAVPDDGNENGAGAVTPEATAPAAGPADSPTTVEGPRGEGGGVADDGFTPEDVSDGGADAVADGSGPPPLPTAEGPDAAVVVQGDADGLFFISTDGEAADLLGPDGNAEGAGTQERRSEFGVGEGEQPSEDEDAESDSPPVVVGPNGEPLNLGGEEEGGGNRPQQAEVTPLQDSPRAGVGVLITGRPEREPDESDLSPDLVPPTSGPDGRPLEAPSAPRQQDAPAPVEGALLAPSLLPEAYRDGAPLATDAFSGPLALLTSPTADLGHLPPACAEDDLSTVLGAEDARRGRELAIAAAVFTLGVQPVFLPAARRPAPPERRRWREKR
jgi:hypothetical protein